MKCGAVVMSVWGSVVLACLVLLMSGADAVNSTYMVNNCRSQVHGYLMDRKVLQVNDSMLLELLPLSHINPREVEPRDCIATYRAPQGMKLLVHIEELKINYHPGTIDRLQIYDGANILRELSPNQGLFGNYQHDNLGEHTRSSEGIKDYTSSQQALTLRYTGIPTPEFPGFRVLFTTYQDTNHLGLCRAGMVICAINYKCVFHTVKCDGHQNCGDGDTSDEDKCFVSPDTQEDPHTPATGWDTTDLGLIIACIIGIFILLVVVLWLSVLCIKRKRLRKHLREVQAAAREVWNRQTTLSWPRGLRIPPMVFLQPPPAYTENPPNYSTLDPRFEAPPPYSTLDRDTVTLIESRGESGQGNRNAERHGRRGRGRRNRARQQQQPPPPTPEAPTEVENELVHNEQPEQGNQIQIEIRDSNQKEQIDENTDIGRDKSPVTEARQMIGATAGFVTTPTLAQQDIDTCSTEVLAPEVNSVDIIDIKSGEPSQV